MEISAPDRSIPREILTDLLGYEKEAYVNLRVGRYEKAEELYRRGLDLIMEWQQEKVDRPIHKGAPLHMVGICLTYRERTDEAVKFFLLAYIEDTLNAGFKLESEADLAPASLMLRNAFQIDVNFLRNIKDYVMNLKREGAWAQARNPAKILDAVLKRVRPPSVIALCKAKPKFVQKKPIDPLPATWDKRVFIGGDYDHISTLRDIKEAVINSGFEPILPYEFIVPAKLIHHHDLMLFHCCRLGIFEVSAAAGQLMEIERANDYGVKVILFYTDRDGPPHSLSSMLLTAGYEMRAYKDTPDLKQKVKIWLANF